MSHSTCRFCGQPLQHTVVDLGMSPLCESYLAADQLNQMEPFYPLHVYVCAACFLVQLEEYVNPSDIFSEYAYFSSYSDSWLEHARAYTAQMTQRFGLHAQSRVVEVGSNDGYLLQYFVEQNVPVLGIEPAANVAAAAVAKGVPTHVAFFGAQVATQLARDGQQADLLIGNNVLAQIPDLNDFVKGFKRLLKPAGAITIEVPHVIRLMDENQFDTIYHEHFSYFSLSTAQTIFAAHGLTVFDVESLPTHGGSLRLYIRHAEEQTPAISPAVNDVVEREVAAGLTALETYTAFAERVKATKRKLLEFLIAAKQNGKTVAGYGAPGKGNTLLNYCGIRSDFIDYTVDRNPYKQGKFLPGTHIPIHHPEQLQLTRPDYVLILPWNLKDEIMRQIAYIRDWGGQFVVPIPEVQIFA
jgi:2-polyprenyl-3-methyl-5-hydroxy-6-metoxy-1,4-benzoquinol methylase